MRIEGGQGFYVETRLGRSGHPFTCWKIRTLPKGAARLDAAEKTGVDPRASPLGRFLRRSSLDELPQLLNVLRGEMSLVGPRPIPQSELSRYGARKWIYLSQKPGLTGLWQVSGRNAVSYNARIEFDRIYFRTASLGTDLSILARTLREVCRLSGR